MAEPQQKELYGFSMPDRTTWIGLWQLTEPTKLEKILIVDTPSVQRLPPMQQSDPFVNLQIHFAQKYRAVILRRKGEDKTQLLADTNHFDPSKAIARWYLQPYTKE